jgi:hypothetical protein
LSRFFSEFVLALLDSIPLLHHTHLSPPAEVCDIPDQAENITSSLFKSEALSLTRVMDDYRVRKIDFFYVVSKEHREKERNANGLFHYNALLQVPADCCKCVHSG